MNRIAQRLLVTGALLTTGALGCADPLIPGPLVTGERGITSIAADDFFVYWATGDGAVKKVSIDGGAVTTLVPASAQHLAADHLAVDDTHVVWTIGETTVATVPKDGGEAAILVEYGGKEIRGLSLDASHVYWSEGEGTLQKAPRIGGAAELLASGQSEPGPPALLTTGLFWTTGIDAGQVMKMQVDGGEPTPVVATASKPKHLAVTSSNLYWTTLGDSTNGTVNVASLGGDDARMLASGQEKVDEVAGDLDAVYWTSSNGTVSTVSLQGGEPTAIVKGPKGKVSLAIGLDSLYWANGTDGELWTMHKPSSAAPLY
ncbi:MAG: hypothetical protein ABI193_24745 [Minicystis sp.]